jgi:hypothetical protein
MMKVCEAVQKTKRITRKVEVGEGENGVLEERSLRACASGSF